MVQICSDFSPDSDKVTFSQEEALLWILYFSRKQRFEEKNILIMDFFSSQTWSFWLHKMLIVGLEWCGLFISCLDSHSDGTHSLQRIHWWASDEMLHFSKSVPVKK